MTINQLAEETAVQHGFAEGTQERSDFFGLIAAAQRSTIIYQIMRERVRPTVVTAAEAFIIANFSLKDETVQ